MINMVGDKTSQLRARFGISDDGVLRELLGFQDDFRDPDARLAASLTVLGQDMVRFRVVFFGGRGASRDLPIMGACVRAALHYFFIRETICKNANMHLNAD